MNKEINALLDKIKGYDFRAKINELYARILPYALKAGRVASRPLLQFYYVMKDENTSKQEKLLIYAAIIYIISPFDLLPATVFKLLGILDDAAVMIYVHQTIKDKITPEINAKVNDTLNEWFGVEYEMIETGNK